jgi:Right handed beta helix region
MRRSLLPFVVLAVLALPAAAQAATIVVNTPEANSTAPGCGLADAIDAANTDATSAGCAKGEGADRIEFAASSLPAIVLTKALPPIHGILEIAGPGADQLTISGHDEFRVFEVGSEGEAGALSLSGVTIANGWADESGAGVLVQQLGVAQLTRVTVRDNEVEASPTSFHPNLAEGAGLMNHGRLTITESTVTGNTARNTTAAAEVEANGGGVAGSEGELVIVRSTVSGNAAIVEASTENSDVRGGGVFVFMLSTLAVRGSTVSGNEVETNSATGDEASGGGVLVWEATPQATIEGSTIAGNTALVGANVLAAGPLALGNTIVARPLGGGADCAGATSSLGFNLDEGSSCNFGLPSDQRGVDPQLAADLAANGGPTETLALLNGSPAIDHGLASFAETADQRGFKRPVEIPSVPNAPGGDGADVGAYEVQVPRVAITRGPRDGETIVDAQPSFEFLAESGATGFVCAIDGDAPAPCSSPFKAPQLSNGGHKFTVTALGEAGYASEPASRVFTVEVKSETPPPATVKPKKAPQTKLGGLPSKTTKLRLTIRFSASEAGSTFQCKLDQRKWRSCRSPYKTPKLALGKHVFKVKAKGTTGLVDSSPATKKFRVVTPKRG